MMMQRSIIVLASLLMFFLSGCSFFGEKPEKSPATLRTALEIPPDLARPAGNDLASVPPSGSAAYSEYSANTPATDSAAGTSAAADSAAGTSAAANGKLTPASTSVRLERDGSLRWLVVQHAPNLVMEHVRRFISGRNMELAIDNPKSGIFETEWKERKINLGTNALTRMLASMQSTGLRDKFRFRIEPGRVDGTSEIYVSHLGLEEVLISGSLSGPSSTWQPRATDLQAEAEQLSALMTSFGKSEQEAKDQVGMAAAGSAIKAKDGLLLQRQDIDQAWRRVGQALDRSGFAIEDRDRERGIYYLYDRATAGTAKKSTFFGGWLKFGESAEVIEDRFQVVLKALEGGISLKLLNVKGERTESKNGERLLEYLLQQLQ